MKTRKPRVFVASTFKGLERERRALVRLFENYKDKIDFWGYEAWEGGLAPDLESRRKVRESDYLVLIIGGRYGTPDPRSNIGITQLEYEEFLYTHTKECTKPGEVNAIYVFEKDPSYIEPDEADLPGNNLTALSGFINRVRKRHTISPFFNDWRDLQQRVDKVLKRLPLSVLDKEYRKVSIFQFDFEVLGIGPYREEQIETRWSHCPCTVYENEGCEFLKELHYRPPKYLREEMERHLHEFILSPETNPLWKENNPSFKTVSIREFSSKLLFEFCNSTWHQFLGTNQAATRDGIIKEILNNAPDQGCVIELSPFSNNLGLAIAVINKETETLYYTVRKDVSVHSGLKSTAVGTQLHAYDPNHLNPDGTPNIFGAVYQELINEANISKSDIQDLYIAAWGVGTRTGTPELLFVCDSKRPLSKIREDVCEARVLHASEFDRLKMTSRKSIVYDYELLAELDEHPEQWEPESAVACCLALHKLVRNCVSFKNPISQM